MKWLCFSLNVVVSFSLDILCMSSVLMAHAKPTDKIDYLDLFIVFQILLTALDTMSSLVYPPLGKFVNTSIQ